MNLNVSHTDPTEIFQILAKLGEGSYGSVFKALDKRDGQIVAIKVLEIENDDTTDLQKEIAILKECHSEYIVDYKGTYESQGNIWIVMEYCGAGSLCDLMAICERTLNEEQIAVVMKLSLLGLQYLHGQRKIHRDIKSGNILLSHQGDCKLADFGVSAELTTTLAKRKTVIGTPYWMAPEVLQSTEYDGRADIWSLAITAIELAVGEPPHSNVHPMRAIFMIPTSDPPTLPQANWGAEFHDFLRVCLVKNPAERPTAATLLSTHPFILKAKSKAVIAALVDECMQDIDEFREQEAAELENEGDDDNGAETDAGGPGGAGGPGTINYGGGTIVQGGDYGTMLTSGTMVAGDSTGGGGTQPTYMKHLGQHGQAAAGGTWQAGPRGAGGGGGESVQYYKLNKNLDVVTGAPVETYRAALAALNKAEADEINALKGFYLQRRKQLQGLIAGSE